MKKTSLRKPSPSPAKLLKLPQEQQDKLAKWMMDGIAYAELLKRIKNEFDIEFTTYHPLRAFWKIVCLPLVLQRQAAELALGPGISGVARKEIKKVLENPDATIDELKQLLKQLVASTKKPVSATDTGHVEGFNPLDDQDKLDEIRRQVFGSAPNTKKRTEPPPPESPAPAPESLPPENPPS